VLLAGIYRINNLWMPDKDIHPNSGHYKVSFRAGGHDGCPLVIITGTLLTPAATLITTTILIAALFGAAFLSGQVTLSTLALLFGASGVMLLVALLMAGNRHNLHLLDARLLQNRTLLKERALELMQTVSRIETLETNARKLEKQLKEARQESAQRQRVVSVENNELYILMQGAIRNMGESVDELETVIERMTDVPTLNGSQEMVDSAWQRLHGLRTLLIHLDEMSQAELESFSLELEPVELEQIVYDVAATAHGLARGKPIEIKSQIADDLPMVQGDATRLRQVLLHMVSNAIKFTDRGIIEIRGEQDGGHAVIFVSDTGIGMSGEEAARAFEMFGRGETAEAEQRRGAGLGLALCKRLIELHGGRMWVTSVKGVGSTFYMALPTRSPARRPLPTLSKTTMRLGTVPIGKSDKDTVVLPHRTTAPVAASATIAAGTTAVISDGSTRIMPRVVPSAGDGVLPAETSMLRDKKLNHATRPMQPIHRFQPKYIQRFGFILLGLLMMVVTIVGGLAIFNYVTRGQVVETTAVANQFGTKTATTAPAAVAVVTDTPTPQPSPAPTQTESQPAVAVVKEAATATKAAAATDTPAATATAPQAATATPSPSPQPATATPSPSPQPATATPSPSPQPATATPSPSPQPATATPTPQPSVTATNTPSPTATAPQAATATTIPTVVTVSPPRVIAGLDSGTQFTVPPAPNSRVSWSAGGEAAYTGQADGSRDVYVAAPDGGVPANLTTARTDDLQPAWSPDGSRIAFSSGRNGSFDIFVMDADGSNVRQVTGGAGFDEWPAWSPDGQQLAFVSDRDGNPEIYTVNSDGSNLQRRTSHPADEWPVSWAPDGGQLLFASNRDGNWNLYRLSLAGGEAAQLTNDPADERDPVWLSDGSIAFAYNGEGNWDIYTLRPGNGAVAAERWTRLTSSAANERFPAQQ
jgi:signal transduction histidine kinase/outer membrane biosynthesis protein TonB